MAQRGKKLTPELRQKVLAAWQFSPNMTAVAKQLGLSSSTVHGIVKGVAAQVRAAAVAEPPPPPDPLQLPALETTNAEGVRAMSYELAGSTTLLARKLLQLIQGGLASGELGQTKEAVRMLRDMAVPHGIFVDKARVMNDQPTQIWETVEPMLKLPPGIEREDIARVLKAAIHGRTALPEVVDVQTVQPVQKKPPKPILHVAPA